MAYRHPQVPWIVYQPTTRGYDAHCERSGDSALCRSELALHQFAAAHAGVATHHGVGDLVARATHALGMQQCSPCAQRQAALNRRFPQAWRRR